MTDTKIPEVSPGEARIAARGNPRCLILNPTEADLLASKDADMIGYLTDLGEHVGGWEGEDVEFCDPLGEVVFTVRHPEGVMPWTSIGHGRIR